MQYFQKMILDVLFAIFFGSGALSGKVLLVRIIENNKIDVYLRAG